MDIISDSGRSKYRETKRFIRQAMDEHQLVLFVGAGASVESGIPLWNDAVKDIARHLEINTDKFDNTVIPQYYYNSRGGKEYIRLIREIFKADQKLVPNEVHEKIIQFDTDTIITTNYDNLIEMAAEKNGEYIHVVRKDFDLSLGKGGKELIKMHGDFHDNNFVLKEDDYLGYSGNFKLIENYVRSIIGTRMILFVGYSLSDPDVKHIFSWVKDILGEYFQRAYMIVTGRVEEKNEEDYYRHLGVNLIYSCELLGDKDISSDNQTSQLVETLDYLLDEEDMQSGIVSSLYNYLKPFRSMNYIYRKYAVDAFARLRGNPGMHSSLNINTEYYLTTYPSDASEEEKTLLEKLKLCKEKKSDDVQIQLIYEVLRRSEIEGVWQYGDLNSDYLPDKKEWKFSKDGTVPAFAEAIYKFDFAGLEQLKENNARILSDDSPQLYLLQGYLNAFFGDYIASYFCLRNAANCFFAKHEYALYFISLWNKRNVASWIPKRGTDEKIYSRVRKETDSLNLDKTLRSLPDLGNEHNLFLHDLLDFKFTSYLFYDVVSNSIKAGTEAKGSYVFHLSQPAYDDLRQQVYDYYRYVLYNQLYVDRFSENSQIFNLFVRAILSSVCASDSKTDNTPFGTTHNIHADSLNEKDIHLILRFTNLHDMSRIFSEFRIVLIPVSDSGKDYLKEIAGNIRGSTGMYGTNLSDIFWRLLYFISHTDFDVELAGIILDSIVRQTREDFQLDGIGPVHGFVSALIRQNFHENKAVCRKALTLLEWLLGTIESSCFSNASSACISDLALFCQKGGCLIESMDVFNSVMSDERFFGFLSVVYNDCSESIKEQIRIHLSKWCCPDNVFGYTSYCKFVFAGIIPMNSEYEKKVLDFIQGNVGKTSSVPGEDQIETGMVFLYLEGLVFDRDRLLQLVKAGRDNFHKWLMDADGFDYSDFKLEWLKCCQEQFLEKLSSETEVRRNILDIYRNEISAGNVDEETNRLVVKYFV